MAYRQTEDPPGPTPPFTELYEVAVVGGGATRLNDDLPPGGNCLAFEFSADRRHVVFLADGNTTDVQELYSVPRIVVCPTDDPLDDDGICESFDNCPAVANPTQADTDGDRVGDACDCAPNDPVTSRPAPVTVSASRGGPGSILLGWSVSPAADGYTVLRGSADVLPAGDYGTCLAVHLLATSTSDPDLPAAGSTLTYLIVPESVVCGNGGWGEDSAGDPRGNTNPATCLPPGN